MENHFDINFMLTGKVAVITGGASGIGRATAELFANKGAKLALFDINKETASIAKEISPEAIGLRLDITDVDAIDRAIGEVVSAFGRIDILCNIAGLGHSDNAENISKDVFDRIIAVNLTGLFFMCQRVGLVMIKQGGGKIINMSSQAGIVGLSQHALYGATKAAVINITKTLANEWGRYKINVNAVSPTVILTPMSAAYWSGERGEEFLKKIPMGRFGYMDEAAACFLYLASGAADLISGENLVLDGGFTVV